MTPERSTIPILDIFAIDLGPNRSHNGREIIVVNDNDNGDKRWSPLPMTRHHALRREESHCFLELNPSSLEHEHEGMGV